MRQEQRKELTSQMRIKYPSKNYYKVTTSLGLQVIEKIYGRTLSGENLYKYLVDLIDNGFTIQTNKTLTQVKRFYIEKVKK